MIESCSSTSAASSREECPLVKVFFLYRRTNFQMAAVGVLEVKLVQSFLHPLFSLLRTLLQRATSLRKEIQLSRVGSALYIRQSVRREATASEHLIFHQGAGAGDRPEILLPGPGTPTDATLAIIPVRREQTLLYFSRGFGEEGGEKLLP